MLKYLSTLFLFFLSSYNIIAQNSDTMQSKVMDRLTPTLNYIVLPYDNPALNYYRFKSSLSSFSLEGTYDYQKEAVVQEKGKGGKSFSINANSYIVSEPNTRLWGNALYKNGKKKDVYGNESSDYNLIYPYVTADTIGGNLNSETYAFSGGYAHRHKKFTYGVDFYYRSLIEYREIDPRPRNIVSDLNLKIGIVYDITKLYKSAFSFAYKRYKQIGDISFYNPLGFSNIFHLNGLGMDYSRFSGRETGYSYKGDQINIQLSILPISLSGISVAIGYSNFTYNKELTALNKLPLNRINNNKIDAEIVFKEEVNKNSIIGVKAIGYYKQQDGTENIFGSSTNAYIQISKAHQFFSQDMQAGLEGLYQSKLSNKAILFVNANVKWNRKEEKYNNPNRKWGGSYIGYGITAGSIIAKKHNTLFFKIIINKLQNIDNNLLLTQSQMPNYFERLIQLNNNWLKSDVCQFGFSFYTDFTIKNLKNKVLFIEGTWNYCIYEYKFMHTNMVILSMGIKL